MVEASGQTSNYLDKIEEVFSEGKRLWSMPYTDFAMFRRRSSNKSSRVA